MDPPGVTAGYLGPRHRTLAVHYMRLLLFTILSHIVRGMSFDVARTRLGIKFDQAAVLVGFRFWSDLGDLLSSGNTSVRR